MGKPGISIGDDTPTGEPRNGPKGPYIDDETDDMTASAARSGQDPTRTRPGGSRTETKIAQESAIGNDTATADPRPGREPERQDTCAHNRLVAARRSPICRTNWRSVRKARHSHRARLCRLSRECPMPSAVIRDYEYDDESRVLCIIFVSGKIYEYEQVPASVYLGLSTAFSKGTFFNRFIKDQYRYREIAPSQD